MILEVTRGLGGRRIGKLFLRECRVSVWDNEKLLEIDTGDGCSTLCH